MACVVCNGTYSNNCSVCGGTGRMAITDCPEKFITPDIWQFIQIADLWEKGIPPIAGGSLEQSQNFVFATGFYFGEKQHWKNKLGILS